MPSPEIEEALINGGSAILSSENIAIATLGVMLALSVIANVVQYRDYRSDRAQPWQFVHDLTETLQEIRITIAGLK